MKGRNPGTGLFKAVALLPLFILTGMPLAALDSVWNHAYQENWNPDSVIDILADARNAYVLLDAFDDLEARNAIPEIKGKGNTVGVYMSIGTGEDWREDFNSLEKNLVKKPWGEWAGEYFVDNINEELVAVMEQRIRDAASWGADFVEFDNMDWAFDEDNRNRYGFHATVEESLEYADRLRRYANSLGLSCMAKNIMRGAESFQGVTWESWSDDRDWWDSGELKDFIANGKLCVIFHYRERNPEEAESYYLEHYGSDLLVLIETRKDRGYRR